MSTKAPSAPGLVNLWEAGTTAAALKMLFTLLIILVLLNALSGTVADPDLWGYLAFGRLFWESGRFPYQDIFAYVPTLKVWVYHEWLTGVLFYPLYRHLGAPGLQVFKYLMGLAATGLIYLTARRRGAHFWSILLGLWITQTFLVIGYSPVRAQVFTYLFFALSLYLLESARLGGRWRGLLWLAPLQVLWCNLHGGFLAGLGLIALYAGGEFLARRPFWPYLAVFLAGGAATLINPYGLDYWTYMFRAVTMPRPEISEWASVIRAWQAGQPREPIVSFAAVAAFTLLLAGWYRWREITPMLIMGLTLYLGLKHQRHQTFFLMAAGAYLPVLLEAFGHRMWAALPSPRWRHHLSRTVPAVLALGLLLAYGYKNLDKTRLTLELPSRPAQANPAAIHYPTGAVAYIQEHRLAGKLLNEFNWGEYLLYVLHPSCRVAMDGRYETVYSDELHQLHSDFFSGRSNWRTFLEKYPPELILVDPRSRVYALLQEASDWRQVYRDAGAALFLPHTRTSALPPSP